MVQVTQSNRLSQVPGSAGQQQVVQDQGPTLAEGIAGTVARGQELYDTVGTAYAEAKAKELTEESLEDIDSAIALAEKNRDEETFVKSGSVSDDEFTIIEGAVASGGMSREKARLLASSRLRTRISEQPMFADKLRQAASNVIGFNIQSEPARQYFAAFQTAAQQQAARGNSYRDKKWDIARTEAAAMEGVSAEDVFKQLIQSDQVARRKQMLLDQQELGTLEDQEMFTEFNQENSKVAFAGIMGEVSKEFKANGSVDEAVWTQVVEAQKALELDELAENWSGDQTSQEYQRAQSVIEDRYSTYQGFIDSVGFDTLQKLGLERVERARKELGNEMFREIKLIEEGMGAEIAGQAMELFSDVTDPSRLAMILKQNPQLGRAGVILGNPTAIKMFGDKVKSVYQKINTNQPFDENDVDEQTGTSEAETADWVMSKAWNKGGDGERTVLDYLTQQGQKIKPLSLAVSKAPTKSEPETRQFFENSYKNDLPRLVDSFSSAVAQYPDIEWTIDNDGNINVVPPTYDRSITGRENVQQEMLRINRLAPTIEAATRSAEQINLYNQGINRGWGTVAKTTQSEHRRKLEEGIDIGMIRQSKRFEMDAQALVLEGDNEGAREMFNDMQRLNPNYKEFTFEDFQEVTRRLNNIDVGA